MKLEEFVSGNWVERYQYQSFEPRTINHIWSWEDTVTNTLLEQSNRALGELNAFSLIVPDIDLFLRMHVMKEAQQSSKIEGTQTRMDEALMSVEQIQPEKRDDWQEVQNYVEAINAAINQLVELPISNRLLRETHRTLMQGVRGEHKLPGEFRRSQNWIGGSSLKDAVFIPPHHDGVESLMGDLEQFLHNEQINVPNLVRIAIAHYQFETIHPFLDGNGRIGRLMIPLFLISKGMLKKPSLYLSDFFERHRASYYDALMRVRTSNDLVHWVRFFLNGVYETATKGTQTFQQLLQLRSEVERQVMSLKGRSENARMALEYLYSQPVVSAGDLARKLNISIPTSNKLIRTFEELNILNEFTNMKRGRLYVFKAYLDLFAQ